MAPHERRRDSPERRTVLRTARHTLTDLVPQTAATAKQMHRRLQQSARTEERRQSTRQPAGRRDTTPTVTHRVWPPASPLHNASGLELPAPMQLLLPANSSEPPFMPGSTEQLVAAPNTGHGRSGPAQLVHRLTQFKRVSPDKYKRQNLAASSDPLRHEPRPAREPKPEPEQSGWYYTVQSEAGLAMLRTSSRSRCAAPNRARSSIGSHRPHTSDSLFTTSDGDTLKRHTANHMHGWAACHQTWNARASSRLTASTPDGTMSPRKFRLDIPDSTGGSWARSPSQSSKEDTGIVAKPKLATLRELSPGSRHHVAGLARWSGLPPNPFSQQPHPEPDLAKEERRPGTPEWAGAYRRSTHDAVHVHVRETAKALAAGASNTTVAEAKARMSTKRQLTPDMIRTQ